jgi:bacterioferritin
MRGNDRVIAALNEALKSELTAINQYFVHAEMCQNWGYDRLYEHTKKEAISEMKHAEELIERILFLDGEPNMSELFPIRVGKNVKQQVENDLAAELDAVARYNASVQLCREVGDNGSREIFEKLLADEEGHVDYLEAQLHQMQEIGLERYLSQQIREK